MRVKNILLEVFSILITAFLIWEGGLAWYDIVMEFAIRQKTRLGAEWSGVQKKRKIFSYE